MENRPLSSGKVGRLLPWGDFVVLLTEINRLYRNARESALSKIKQEPTSG